MNEPNVNAVGHRLDGVVRPSPYRHFDGMCWPVPGERLSDCDECEGQGSYDVWKAVAGHYEGGEYFRMTCDTCGGIGKLDDYGNPLTGGRIINCCFPDCGCDGARLCMAENGASGSACAINLERGSFRA